VEDGIIEGKHDGFGAKFTNFIENAYCTAELFRKFIDMEFPCKPAIQK
jgi:hypothetical protein